MKKHDEYVLKTEAILEPIIEANDFELVDVEFVKEGNNMILRAYIDKEGGITINDCEIVNRALSDKLDEEDYIDEPYILEVSSPGLGRQLKKDKDYIRSIGKDIDIKLFKEIVLVENGKNIKAKEFSGRLDGFDEETITVFLGEQTMVFSRKDIAIVRLSFDF
ncbi:MAG: ribosome maturation factor RimP [Lachnospiraceae bacterium]|nr:ribosome maturation factor RimP [Lachnospiraceae bacterium]